MKSVVADYVHTLGLDAYLVGGAVRDELLGFPSRDLDFVVPGLGQADLRAALAPHGKVEDLVVAEQRVGVRLLPRSRAIRLLAPAGIEFAPPRREVSTGPGRHEFEIVADPSISLEEDMKRRDFTVNAMARRLATSELLDPLGGQADLERRILRTTSPTSFRDDPLRIVRGLRFVSQLGFDPAPETELQMREWAGRIQRVSAERIGGGLAADGMGELSKLLLGPEPAKALRLGRDAGVLEQFLPEFTITVGYEQRSPRQDKTLDEHIFAVVQSSAEAGDKLPVRLAALLHDLGKPEAHRAGAADHAAIGATIATSILRRLRYPTKLQEHVGLIVRAHSFEEKPDPTALDARRFLARYGLRLALDLVAHKTADLAAKRPKAKEVEGVARLRRLLAEQLEAGAPYRRRDLAVAGADLIDAGLTQGPELGHMLTILLEEVIEDPSRNERGWLLERAFRERS